jgi:hypothetical protein
MDSGCDTLLVHLNEARARLDRYINIWIDQIELDGTLAKIRAKWLTE